jgi:hypothetical protein
MVCYQETDGSFNNLHEMTDPRPVEDGDLTEMKLDNRAVESVADFLSPQQKKTGRTSNEIPLTGYMQVRCSEWRNSSTGCSTARGR